MKKVLLLFLCLLLFVISCKKEEKPVEEEIQYDFTTSSSTIENDYYTDSVYEFYFDDEYFFQSSHIFNPSLATLSLGLSISSYEPDSTLSKTNSAKKMLSDFGFTNFSNNLDYIARPAFNTFGVLVGSKKIGDYYILAVVTRSLDYDAEFANNFLVGYEDNNLYGFHQGFYNAASKIVAEIENHINKFVDTSKVKIFLTGYSRGAAASNIAGALLDIKASKGEKIGKVGLNSEDIFSYTCATPRGVDVNNKNLQELKVDFSNLYSINFQNDIVPKVVPASLGFDVLGNCYYFPTNLTMLNYQEYVDKINENQQNTLIEKDDIDVLTTNDFYFYEYENHKMINPNIGLIFDKIFTSIGNAAIDRKTFVDKYQDAMVDLLNMSSNDELNYNAIGAAAVLKEFDMDALEDDLFDNQDEFVTTINEILKKLFVSNPRREDIINDVNTILPLILFAAKDIPAYIYSILDSDNLEAAINYHMPHLCMDALMEIDPKYGGEKSLHLGNYHLIKIAANNLKIYASNNLIVEINDGMINSASVCVEYYDDTYFIYLPIGNNYEYISLDGEIEFEIYEFVPTRVEFLFYTKTKTTFNALK